MSLGSYASGLLAIFRYSFRKILLNRRWVLALLLMVLVGLVMGYAGSQGNSSLGSGTDLLDTLILAFIMPVISMIYGSSLIRNEIEDRSITQVITAPLDRAISYIGYYISLAAALSLVLTLMNLVGWLAYFSQQGIDGDSFTILGGMVALSIIGSLVYSALFQATGVIFTRPVYFGLFYAFIWEALIGSIPGAISTFTVKHYVRSLGSQWLDFGGISSYDGASVGTAFLVLIALTIACLAIGAFVFRDKEYP